ncbi:hypothetical protein LINPERHAP2_LOCUS24573, partial [Linum perenne]
RPTSNPPSNIHGLRVYCDASFLEGSQQAAYDILVVNVEGSVCDGHSGTFIAPPCWLQKLEPSWKLHHMQQPHRYNVLLCPTAFHSSSVYRLPPTNGRGNVTELLAQFISCSTRVHNLDLFSLLDVLIKERIGLLVRLGSEPYPVTG